MAEIDPKEPLANRKREAFARLLATPGPGGNARSQRAAYQEAFGCGSAKWARDRAAIIMHSPELRARVAYLTEEADKEFWAQVKRQGIAVRARRILKKLERYEELEKIVSERAEEFGGQAPGSGTGYLVRTVKQIGGSEKVDEWVVDTGLLSALDRIEESVAEETGQRIKRIHVSDLTDEQILALLGAGEPGEGSQ